MQAICGLPFLIPNPFRKPLWRKAPTDDPACSSSIPIVTFLPFVAARAYLPISTPALKNAGKTKAGTTIVSVDGGCAGVRNVKAGVIDATSQQYPLLMASRGVAAVVKYAKTGVKPSGYTDTGVNLIAKKALAGVKSKTVKYGLANCWG